jgi:hypothetical protein
LAQKKLVTQYSFTNFFIAKRRDRVQERGTRTVSKGVDFNSVLLRKQFMSPVKASFAQPETSSPERATYSQARGHALIETETEILPS